MPKNDPAKTVRTIREARVDEVLVDEETRAVKVQTSEPLAVLYAPFLDGTDPRRAPSRP